MATVWPAKERRVYDVLKHYLDVVDDLVNQRKQLSKGSTGPPFIVYKQ